MPKKEDFVSGMGQRSKLAVTKDVPTMPKKEDFAKGNGKRTIRQKRGKKKRMFGARDDSDANSGYGSDDTAAILGMM